MNLTAKELKSIIQTLKPLAAWPVEDPSIEVDHGVISACNLGKVRAEYHSGQAADWARSFSIRALTKALKAARPKDEVTLDAEGLRAGAARYDMPHHHPLEDFPHFDAPEELDSQVVGPLPLEHVVPMMSKDEGRPHLHAILLSGADGDQDEPELRILATDGHRLGWRQTAYQCPTSFLLSGEAVPTLLRLKPTGCAWGSQGAVFLANKWRVYVKPTDARFPPWTKVVPSAPVEWSLVTNRLELLAVVKRALAVGEYKNDKGIIVKGAVRLHAGNTVLAEDHDNGIDFSERFNAELHGEPVELMGFNGRYLVEALQHTSDDEMVELTFRGPTDACIVGGNNVVMPMWL